MDATLVLVIAFALAAAAAQAQPEPLLVSEHDHAGAAYIAYRDTVAFDAMQAFYGKHLPTSFELITQAGSAPGVPTGLYWSWDEEAGATDMAAAVPFTGEPPDDLPDGYAVVTLPPGTAVTVDYYGPYDGLGEAHEAIDRYLGERRADALVAVEEYVTDPEAQPDPAKWFTRVSYVLPSAE